jgi:hypothetical protein
MEPHKEVKEVIEQIVGPFRDRPGIKLIGYEPDPDFDRLPIELLGRSEARRISTVRGRDQAIIGTSMKW